MVSGSAPASGAADDARSAVNGSSALGSSDVPGVFGEGAGNLTRAACARPEMNFSRLPQVSRRRFLLSEMASRVTSMLIQSRPSFSAASIVVPQPQNGSSTTSPES
jgi:hypothetical protein